MFSVVPASLPGNAGKIVLKEGTTTDPNVTFDRDPVSHLLTVNASDAGTRFYM